MTLPPLRRRLGRALQSPYPETWTKLLREPRRSSDASVAILRSYLLTSGWTNADHWDWEIVIPESPIFPSFVTECWVVNERLSKMHVSVDSAGGIQSEPFPVDRRQEVHLPDCVEVNEGGMVRQFRRVSTEEQEAWFTFELELLLWQGEQFIQEKEFWEKTKLEEANEFDWQGDLAFEDWQTFVAYLLHKGQTGVGSEAGSEGSMASVVVWATLGSGTFSEHELFGRQTLAVSTMDVATTSKARATVMRNFGRLRETKLEDSEGDSFSGGGTEVGGEERKGDVGRECRLLFSSTTNSGSTSIDDGTHTCNPKSEERWGKIDGMAVRQIGLEFARFIPKGLTSAS